MRLDQPAITRCHMRGCSVSIFGTCVAFDTTRGFVVSFEFVLRDAMNLMGYGSSDLVSGEVGIGSLARLARSGLFLSKDYAKLRNPERVSVRVALRRSFLEHRVFFVCCDGLLASPPPGRRVLALLAQILDRSATAHTKVYF